jgi:hypothetical protein
MCPYYLDGDRHARTEARARLVIYPSYLANCAVFKDRRGRHRGDSPAGLSKLSSAMAPAEAEDQQGSVDMLRTPAGHKADATDSIVRSSLERR